VWFQQDSATAHTASVLEEVFSDIIIHHGLWPVCSPDLAPCSFYLWGNLKDKVYRTNTHTKEELKEKKYEEKFLKFLRKNFG
jgi:hypothetical protein